MAGSEEPIVFRPLYMERVWGGRMLEQVYGRSLPDEDTPYGESWEVVDREGEQSVVDGGPFDGLTLHELWTDHRTEVFGKTQCEDERFPLLVKILDAREKLSIQVHPPAEVAGELGGEPKTEMWYIADARTEQQVHRIDAKKGEHIFIPSGRLHAIGAGFLIFEIQQNSDTTYRVFDWNRVGLDGKPRELHVEQSLRCIDFEDVEPSMDDASNGSLVDCPLFKVERQTLKPGAVERPVEADRFAIVAVIEGSVKCGGRKFGEGDFLLLPAGEAILEAESEASILVTTLPV